MHRFESATIARLDWNFVWVKELATEKVRKKNLIYSHMQLCDSPYSLWSLLMLIYKWIARPGQFMIYESNFCCFLNFCLLLPFVFHIQRGTVVDRLPLSTALRYTKIERTKIRNFQMFKQWTHASNVVVVVCCCCLSSGFRGMRASNRFNSSRLSLALTSATKKIIPIEFWIRW